MAVTTVSDPAIERAIAFPSRYPETERFALGSSACAMRNIDLRAYGFGFGNMNDFLRAARILEDIGVTAYSGAAGFLKTPEIITGAACLLGAAGGMQHHPMLGKR